MACGGWVSAGAYAVRGRGALALGGASSALRGVPSAQNGASLPQARRGGLSARMAHVPCVRRRMPSSVDEREPPVVARSLVFRRAALRTLL